MKCFWRCVLGHCWDGLNPSLMKMLWAAELSCAELNSLGDQQLVRAYGEIGHPSLTTILTKSPSTHWLITLTPLAFTLQSSPVCHTQRRIKIHSLAGVGSSGIYHCQVSTLNPSNSFAKSRGKTSSQSERRMILRCWYINQIKNCKSQAGYDEIIDCTCTGFYHSEIYTALCQRSVYVMLEGTKIGKTALNRQNKISVAPWKFT